MHEAASARGALKLIERGYKRVAVISGGESDMMKCGFKWIDKGKVKYRDPSGDIRILGK
jgi:hypothetical protein